MSLGSFVMVAPQGMIPAPGRQVKTVEGIYQMLCGGASAYLGSTVTVCGPAETP